MLLLKSRTRLFIHALLIGLGYGCASEGDFQFDDLGTSQGGSLAQFYIEQDFLYVIEESALSIFDITTDTPTVIAKINIDRQGETIAKLGTVLLIGNPVVSDGQYAFITLRSGRNCGGNSDALEIIDISDLKNPRMVSSYSMSSPYGLALMGTNLFVGEKYNGMSWFDVSDVSNITLIEKINDITAIDFIVNGNDLTIATAYSLLQMQLTDTNELIQLSEFKYAEN